jgi:hypothetical protein
MQAPWRFDRPKLVRKDHRIIKRRLKAEDGEIAKRFPLIETPAAAYLQRTEWNVRDTGGTVIFSIGKELTGGSKFSSNFRQ